MSDEQSNFSKIIQFNQKDIIYMKSEDNYDIISPHLTEQKQQELLVDQDSIIYSKQSFQTTKNIKLSNYKKQLSQKLSLETNQPQKSLIIQKSQNIKYQSEQTEHPQIIGLPIELLSNKSNQKTVQNSKQNYYEQSAILISSQESLKPKVKQRKNFKLQKCVISIKKNNKELKNQPEKGSDLKVRSQSSLQSSQDGSKNNQDRRSSREQNQIQEQIIIKSGESTQTQQKSDCQQSNKQGSNISSPNPSKKQKKTKRLTVAVNATDAIVYIDKCIQKKRQNRRKSAQKDIEQDLNLLSIPQNSLNENNKISFKKLNQLFQQGKIKIDSNEKLSDGFKDFFVEKIKQILINELPSLDNESSDSDSDSVTSVENQQNKIKLGSQDRLKRVKSQTDVIQNGKKEPNLFKLQLLKLFEAIQQNKQNQFDNQQIKGLSLRTEYKKYDQENGQNLILSSGKNLNSLDIHASIDSHSKKSSKTLLNTETYNLSDQLSQKKLEINFNFNQSNLNQLVDKEALKNDQTNATANNNQNLLMSLLLDEQTEKENSQENDDEITSESMSQNIKIGIQIGFLGEEADYYEESQSKTATVSVLLEDEQKDKEEPIQSESTFSLESQKCLADSQKSVDKQNNLNIDEKVNENGNQNNDNNFEKQKSLKLQMIQAEFEKIQNSSLEETQKIISNMPQPFNLANMNVQKVKEINSIPQVQEQEAINTQTPQRKNESLKQKIGDQLGISKDKYILNSNTIKNEQKNSIYQKAELEKNKIQNLLQKSFQNIKRPSESKINSEENKLTFQNQLQRNSFLEETKINKQSFRRNIKSSQPSDERSPKSQNSGQVNQSQKNYQKSLQKLEQEKELTKTKFLSSLFKIQHLVKNMYCSNNMKLTTAVENRKKQNEKPEIQEEEDSNKNVKDTKMWQRMIKLINLKILITQDKTSDSFDANQQDLENAIYMSYSTILEDLRENDLSSQAPSNYINNIKRRDFSHLSIISKNVKNFKQNYMQENNLCVESKQKQHLKLNLNSQKDQNQRDDSECSQIISPDNKSGKSFIFLSAKKQGETPQPFIKGTTESLKEKKYFLRQMTQIMNKTDKSIAKICNKSQQIDQDQNSHMINSQQHQRSICQDSVSEVNLSQSSSNQASNNSLKDNKFKKTKRRKTVIQIGSLVGLDHKQDKSVLQPCGSTRNKPKEEDNANKPASLSVCNSYKIQISQKNKSTKYGSIEQYQFQENEIKEIKEQQIYLQKGQAQRKYSDPTYLQKVSSTDNDASKKQFDFHGRNYSEIESLGLSSDQFGGRNTGKQYKIGSSLEAAQSKRRMSQSNAVEDDNNLKQDSDISIVKQKNSFWQNFVNDPKGKGERIEDKKQNLYQTSKKQIFSSDYIFCNEIKTQQIENFTKPYFKGKNLIKSLKKIQQKSGMTKDQLSQNLPQIIDTIKKNQFDQKNQEQKEITVPQSIQVWQCKVLNQSSTFQNLLKRSNKKLLDSKVQEAVFMKKIVDSYEKDLSENIQQIQNLKENLDRMKKLKNLVKNRQRRKTIAPQFLGQMSLQEHHLKQIKNQQMQMQYLKKQTLVQQKNQGFIFESDNQLLKLQEQNQVQINSIQKRPSSGMSSGAGQVNIESSYKQQNYDSPSATNLVGVKSSSGFSKTKSASNFQNKQSINSRNNQNVQNSTTEQDNSGFLSSVSGRGAQEEIIGGLAQDKLPNEPSSINFQSQICGSKSLSKNKEQSQKSELDQTLDQDEYYDSEGDSDSEYYDEEESCSEIGPHNFSKYRITDIRSQSMVEYSVDDSVQGRSIEQLPFQNSISFSPNQRQNNKLYDVNNNSSFIQSNQKNNQVFKNYKNDFFKGSESNYFEDQKFQQTLLNQKQQDNQRIEQFLNKQKFSSEIDMQLAFLQQKTEILKAQNESQGVVKGQKILGLSRRSDNTKDNKILARKFKIQKHEANTPKSVCNDLSNLLQFQLRNQVKQRSDFNSQIKICSAQQNNNRVTDEMKTNLIIDNSLSECKNSSGGTPFSKKFPQNLYNNCDNEADINQHIQNLRKEISDNMLGQPTQQIRQKKTSTGNLDNFGNLFDKVALQNIQQKKDQSRGQKIIQKQFMQELGYETNEEEENQKRNDDKQLQIITPDNQENNKKQTDFSETFCHQLQQRQTTLKKIKRDKMVMTSNFKKRKSILVTNNNPFLFSNELQQKIPKNELLNPFSLSSNLKKQQKTKQFQQARKQELDPTIDLLKAGKPNYKINEDENKSPSNTSSSRQSIASSTFLSKYTISTSTCLSQKKGGKKQINQYVITALIGQGSFSKVKSVINCETKEVFAMKIINKAKLKKRILSVNKLNQFDKIEKEVAIMKKMGHPYVVKLVEIIDDPNHHKQYLICEHVAKGSLLGRISLGGVCESQARKYFRQLCSAVWYCHEVVQIFHRDIKPDNILIDNEDNIKLTDFGVSHSFEDKKRKKASLAKKEESGVNEEDFLQNNAGSDCFFSPEACAGEKYSGKSADIWACAITLYQMVFGKLPFNSVNRIGLYELICHVEPNLNIQDVKLNECTMQNELIDLLQKMLNKQQKNRINFSQIEQHPWVTADGTLPCNFKTDVSYVEFGLDVTEDDLQKAVTPVEQIKNIKFKRI